MTLASIAQRLIDRGDHTAVGRERIAEFTDATPATDGELQEPALTAELATQLAQRRDPGIELSPYAAQPLRYRETGRLGGRLDRAMLVSGDAHAQRVGSPVHAPFPDQRADRKQDSLLAGARPES